MSGEYLEDRMDTPNSYRILSEQTLEDYTIQLVEDQRGAYLLRKISSDRKIILESAPIHSDPIVLAEAREHFPDFLPFSGVPVDAT